MRVSLENVVPAIVDRCVNAKVWIWSGRRAGYKVNGTLVPELFSTDVSERTVFNFAGAINFAKAFYTTDDLIYFEFVAGVPDDMREALLEGVLENYKMRERVLLSALNSASQGQGKRQLDTYELQALADREARRQLMTFQASSPAPTEAHQAEFLKALTKLSVEFGLHVNRPFTIGWASDVTTVGRYVRSDDGKVRWE